MLHPEMASPRPTPIDNHRYIFAVKVTRHHARLASSCSSGSTGRDSHPHGFAERFQSCKLHLIPLSQALLGAIDATAVSLSGGELHSVGGTEVRKSRPLTRSVFSRLLHQCTQSHLG
jgi:hypothetical protein